jgi:hypothetical protein
MRAMASRAKVAVLGVVAALSIGCGGSTSAPRENAGTSASANIQGKADTAERDAGVFSEARLKDGAADRTGTQLAPREHMPIDAGLTLAAHVAITGQQLVLDYEVRNGSARDAYLLNRVFRQVPAWKMGPDVVYVELVPGTRTVRLMKKIDDLPKDVNVAAPIAPFVTPLRAGATFKERVTVPLPVREYREYSMKGPTPAGEPETAVYQNVTFTLGYYWRAEGTREETRDIRGTGVVMPIGPPGKLPEYGVLASKPILIDVPVVVPAAPPVRR